MTTTTLAEIKLAAPTAVFDEIKRAINSMKADAVKANPSPLTAADWSTVGRSPRTS